MTAEQFRRIMELLQRYTKLEAEAQALSDLARSVGTTLPLEGLDAALTSLRSQSRRVLRPELPDGSSPMRLLREDLVAGKAYMVHMADGSYEGLEFIYVDECRDDAVVGGTTPSFWARLDGQETHGKIYYADYGLEPYKKFSKELWWHKTNWVGPVKFDDDVISRLIGTVEVDDLEVPDGEIIE